jgi:hypothetical protein
MVLLLFLSRFFSLILDIFINSVNIKIGEVNFSKEEMIMANITLNKFIEDFIILPLEEKEYLLDIMKKQLIEAKRESIVERTRDCLDNLAKGEVKRGTVKDFYDDLEND